ncbi:MAG TPA: choice-of-anchor J domain-containing protein [Ignavibacteria bacterium]
MKKLIFTFLILVLFSGGLFSQIKIQEGFETSDSINLPSGWSKPNASYPLDPFYNWTVRDSGTYMPGIGLLVKSHSGLKSCAVSWWTAYDTNGTYNTITDAWLVTKQITNVQSTDILKFWASGANSLYSDSIQIWVSMIDSLPSNFTDKLGSILWPIGSTYGNFTQYTYNLASYVGMTIYIGFRYYMNTTVDGYTVYLDDVFVGNPNSITNLGTGIPTKYELEQNYPNPFNPSTSIKFAIPKASDVKITVFNMLGQVVSVPVNENKIAGFYEVKFNGSNLASGSYYYRIEAGNFLETRKMMLIK